MPKLKPVKPTNPILRKSCKTVSRKELHTKKVQGIIEELLDYVYQTSNKGEDRDKDKPSVVGLAANQLGVDLRIAVVDLGIGHKSYNDVHVLINPVITWSSKTLLEKDEGCVNLSNTRGLVKRSKRVKLDALDRSGNRIGLDVSGWPAVLLQHEVGHLNGNLFIDFLDNPKKAHLVETDDFLKYKKNRKEWDKFIDVSDLAVKLTAGTN